MMEKNIKDCFITIQSWMITDLNLKGNELLLYALIYGFSQDGQNTFNGSLNYMMTWLNCGKQTILNTLNSLIDKKLIKKEKSEDKQKCFYKAVKNLDQSKNLTSLKIGPDQSKNWTGLVQNLDRTSLKIRPNNIIYNNDNNNYIDNTVDNFKNENFNDDFLQDEKKENDEKDEVFIDLAKYLKEFVESKKKIKITNSQIISWAKEFKKLFKKISIRGEEQAKKDIEQAIKFLHLFGDEDYIPVVESAKSFCEKFSRIENALKRKAKSCFWFDDYGFELAQDDEQEPF